MHACSHSMVICLHSNDKHMHGDKLNQMVSDGKPSIGVSPPENLSANWNFEPINVMWTSVISFTKICPWTDAKDS